MSNQEFFVSPEYNKMDIDFIHDYLSNRSYWARGRSRASVIRSMQNSLCFGVFDNSGRQIGFARLVTDYIVFAWLMDVFIDKSFRGKGLGKQLISYILNLPELQEVNGIGLRTKDAHTLYESFGFKRIAAPEMWMLRRNDKG